MLKKKHRYMHPQPPLTSLCLRRFLGTIVFRITIYVAVSLWKYGFLFFIALL